MKAWVSGETQGLDGLALEDIDPPAATEGHLLIKVEFAALNFSDILMIADQYQVRPPRPFTPGQEIAGIVVSAPEGSGWAPGDRIASKVDWGGFAEFALVRADMAMAIPEGVDLARAVALPVVYTTAMVALSECATVASGDTLLVHAAAGGIGLAAVEIGKAKGATVIATAGSPEKLALAKAHGADHGIDYHDEDWVGAVRSITEGKGATVILDPVGGDIGEASLRCIARDGTLLIVGFASGRIPKLAANRLLLKRAAAKGVYWNHDDDGPMLARVADQLMALLGNGKINPLVDVRYGLDDLPEALDCLKDRRSVGKLVLRVAR
jgi:NADPH2:quinone reductase